MSRVLSVEPLSSLTDAEEELLQRLLSESGQAWDLADLAVYVVQTSVRQDEIDHLNLTQEEVVSMERPTKTVAPRNASITVGGYVQNYCAREWGASFLRAELLLVPALTATNDEGEPI
jgi:hypothetical protein